MKVSLQNVRVPGPLSDTCISFFLPMPPPAPGHEVYPLEKSDGKA